MFVMTFIVTHIPPINKYDHARQQNGAATQEVLVELNADSDSPLACCTASQMGVIMFFHEKHEKHEKFAFFVCFVEEKQPFFAKQ